MASFDSFHRAFDKDTPVLRLNYGKDPDARWVLWPVFVWRVVAPVPKERKLNLFQRAVLGLARAGVVRVKDVHDRLLITEELAGLVALELQQMGLLDFEGKPTKRGFEWLEDIEEEPADEAQVGHVLSDGFNGKLWPRFLTGDLPIADVESNDDGWPVLLSGSAGGPRKDWTFSVLPTGRDGVVVTRPSARDVLRVARLHHRQRDFDEVEDDRDVPRLQRVSFVDDSPQPFLLALRACRHQSGDWMVDDPFGHGEAVDLRARLEERLDSHRGLRQWLEALVGVDPAAPTLGHLQVEAEWRVEERLTVAIRHHAVVRERLVAMQRALLEAEGHDAPADKWDDVLLKADIAIMWALRVIHQPYAETHTRFFEELDRVPVPSRNPIADAARIVGLDREVPSRILSVSRREVMLVEKGKGNLPSAIALALLAARWNDDHPLRRGIKSHPDLLHRLNDLALARNPAAHGDATRPPLIVHHQVDAVYAAVEALLLAR